ncbi:MULTISPECIES: type VII secretion target [unclassified Actinoplanes]|uniref:type VII secretion target n=1 Tax=unclassified Actinoplanes TaxID=2626549 RepID=UPI0012FAFB1C|nr:MULTISPECIES: type VII secretion target [unclassified Actinoplanes]
MEISPDEVRRHARDVDEVARMLDEARSAGAGARMSSDAYGYLIGPLFTNLYLHPQGDELIDVMRHASEGMRGLADQLRTMATAFEETDGISAAGLRRIR